MEEELQTPRGKRPTGRRSGDSGTRDSVLDAALELFSRSGFEAVSMRSIASRAGVDPALVRHFFGSKERLFAETVADRTIIPERIRAALDCPPEEMGHRAADTYLRLWEDPQTRPILMALVRSAMTSEPGIELLVESIYGRVAPGAQAPDIRNPKLRGVGLAASHLLGTAIARHVLHLPVIVDMSHDELVDSVAPTIHRYLTAQN